MIWIGSGTSAKLLFLMQDSDERAVAYIAGKAPSRWGRFGADTVLAPPMLVVSPQVLPPNASSAQIDRNTEVRRAHPLYADVSLRLLTEIMNSRLFTTVSPLPLVSTWYAVFLGVVGPASSTILLYTYHAILRSMASFIIPAVGAICMQTISCASSRRL